MTVLHFTFITSTVVSPGKSSLFADTFMMMAYHFLLAGNRITPWVHVVGLADAFDALIHPRVYKPAFPPAQARDMIVSGACGRFEPDIAECFAESLPNFFVSVYQQPFAC